MPRDMHTIYLHTLADHGLAGGFRRPLNRTLSMHASRATLKEIAHGKRPEYVENIMERSWPQVPAPPPAHSSYPFYDQIVTTDGDYSRQSSGTGHAMMSMSHIPSLPLHVMFDHSTYATTMYFPFPPAATASPPSIMYTSIPAFTQEYGQNNAQSHLSWQMGGPPGFPHGRGAPQVNVFIEIHGLSGEKIVTPCKHIPDNANICNNRLLRIHLSGGPIVSRINGTYLRYERKHLRRLKIPSTCLRTYAASNMPHHPP